MEDKKTPIINKLMGIEGDYTDNPKDSGGKTKYGITERVARKHGFTGDMKDLYYSYAYGIYVVDYWRPLYLDNIVKISEKLAEELIDTGINCGIQRISEHFQRCLNVLNNQGQHYPDIKVDGDIGPATFAAFEAFYNKRGEEGCKVLITMLNCLQGQFYISLAEARQKDEEFIYGWFKNRVLI